MMFLSEEVAFSVKHGLNLSKITSIFLNLTPRLFFSQPCYILEAYYLHVELNGLENKVAFCYVNSLSATEQFGIYFLLI